jgi:iron(III) transport system permease protein
MTTRLRCLFACLLTFVLVGPLALLVAQALLAAEIRSADVEPSRVASLVANTLGLAAGAVLIVVPAGVVAAVLLERVAVPGRSLLRAAVVVGLFVPLPVTAVAWQIILGSWLPPLSAPPGQVAWRPWAQGLLPAAWVHGMAGLPWVVWIVGAVLRSTDRALEEDALLDGGPAVVLRTVVVPRAAVAAVAAAAWVVVQTSTEITVTDAMMVRTFAEEVYTQFVGAADGWAGAVVLTLPVWLAAAVGAVVVVGRVGGSVWRPAAGGDPPRPVRYGRRYTAPAALALWLGAALFAGLPLAALAWKAGGGGTREGWRPEAQADTLARVVRADGPVLAGSAGTAAFTGAVAAAAAYVSCRLAVGSRGFAVFLVVLCAVSWATPGPLAGLGLKAAIDAVVSAEAFFLDSCNVGASWEVFRPLLYDRPSPLPAVWAGLVRLFPVAVAVIWPAVRAVPRDLLDAAQIDGLSFVGEWRAVFGPLAGGAVVRAAVAVAALALGEVSASKLVNPPGRSAYVLRLFDQMHYGAESTVAALALVQVAATAAVAVALTAPVADPRPRPAQ